MTAAILAISVLLIGVMPAALTHWKSAEPIGQDGYYYVVQATSILSLDGLYFSSLNVLPLGLVAALSLLVGDVVLGAKVATVILAGSATAAIALAVWYLTRSPGLTLLGAALLAFSSRFHFLVVEFIANLSGIAILAFLLWRFLSRDSRRAEIIGVTLLLFSHRSAAVIWATVVIVAAGARRLPMQWLSKQATSIAAAAIPAVSISVVVAPYIFRLALPASGERLLDEFVTVPFLGMLGPQPSRNQQLLLWLSAAMLWCRLIKGVGGASARKLGIVLGVALLFTANPWGNYSGTVSHFAVRLALTGTVFLAIALPYALHFSVHRPLLRYTVGACALLVVYLGPSPRGADPAYLSRRNAVTTGACHALADADLLDSFVVAQHGYQFALTAKCGVRSATKPQWSTASAGNLLWLVNGATLPPWRAPGVLRLDQAWYLAPDVELRRLMETMPGSAAKALAANSRIALPRLSGSVW